MMTFPSGGTPENPLLNLQITGSQLPEGDIVNRSFYLAQNALLNIYGWYNANYVDWHIKYASAVPGHNITRTDIRDQYDNWQGYQYTSDGVTGGTTVESFDITLTKIDSRQGTTDTYTWTFFIMPSGEPTPTPEDPSEDSGREYVTNVEDGQIFISDPDFSSQYLLYQANKDFNCVETYTIYGGCEQPFEYVKLKINKKQLSVIAPELIDNIIPGRNIVSLFGPGQGEYVVTKCEKSMDTWSVIAYSVMEQIRGIALSEPQSIAGNTPISIIQNVVRNATVNYSVYGADPRNLIRKVEYYVRKSNNTWKNSSNRQFPIGTNCWYIIQVCALRLNAKVWMADGILYVIDPSLTSDVPQSQIASSVKDQQYPFIDMDTIYLNRQGGFPIKPNTEQTDVLENVVSTPELGDDGVAVIRNYVIVNYTDSEGERATAISNTNNSIKSQKTFNPKSHSLDLVELGPSDAQDIANMLADRYCDAETSISFTMREISERTVTVTNPSTQEVTTTKEWVWIPFFKPLTCIRTIVDFYNEMTVSVISNIDGTVTMNKGMLSRYETEFPQFLTTYTFAMSVPTDATQNNSEILNAIRNG